MEHSVAFEGNLFVNLQIKIFYLKWKNFFFFIKFEKIKKWKTRDLNKQSKLSKKAEV